MAGLRALLLLLAGGVPLAAALSCAPCQPADCRPPRCPGATVPDACGCCQVCARAEGERCGGYFDSLGRCGTGLTCQTRPLHGQLVGVASEGVCTRKETGCEFCQLMLGKCVCSEMPDCQLPDVSADPTSFTSRHECEKAAGQPVPTTTSAPTVGVPSCPGVGCPPAVTSCPADSVLKSSPAERPDCCPPASECVCDLESCSPAPACPEGQKAAVVVPGRRVPGRCCSQWACQPTADRCANVTCPPAADSCPADSYRVPSMVEPAHCCRGACQCLPDLCRSPVCPPGTRLRTLQAGTGQPGACCPVYQCAEEVTCEFDNRTYRNGETWQHVEKCKICSCKDAVVFCDKVKCPALDGCSQDKLDPDQCCPHCVDGCLSRSGVFHNSSEQWLEDDCTTCHCAAGKPRCHVQMCRTNCSRPRLVPGRCCPVCDECDLMCLHGYRVDEEGNPLCECRTADDVARDPPKCRSMAGCKKKCQHGFKLDENGCRRCKCRRCRKLKDCSLKCPAGLERNERGCPVCKCRSEEPPTPAGHLSCVATDGAVHADGDSWHDGCRQCVCHAGAEMCSVISCPVPACKRPDIAPGHCCPTCPDDAAASPLPANVTVCQSVDGGTYLDGQTWDLDPCTRCVCLAGAVLCGGPQCPPAPCARPERPAGTCCASCPAVGPAVGGGRPCAGAAGEGRADGATWRRGACRSCRCEDGAARCFHERCAPLDCARPVLKKGQCCPVCLEPAKNSSCVYNNRTMQAGDTWDVNTCTSCVCRAGQVVCASKICSVACENAVPVPDQCCPVCRDDTGTRRNYDFLNGTSKATHRTRVSAAPGGPTQTSRPGIEPETGGSPSTLHIVLYAALPVLALLVILAVCCLLLQRRHKGYRPRQDRADEKKPLKGPATLDCTHMNGMAVLQSQRSHDKPNISLIQNT